MSDTIINEDIAQILLDRFEERLNLPIALYQVDHQEVIVRSKHYSPFCAYIRQSPDIERTCEADHLTRAINASRSGTPNTLPCYMGLFNRQECVYVDGKHVATILSGQRFIRGRRELSKSILKNNIGKVSISSHKQKEMMGYYEKIEELESSTFSVDAEGAMKRLAYLIGKLAEDRHRLERERDTETFRNRVSSIAHEFLLPIQSVIASNELAKMEISRSNTNLNKVLKSLDEIESNLIQLHISAENMRSDMLNQHEPDYELYKEDVGEILRESLYTFQPMAEEKYIVLQAPICTSGRFPYLNVAKPHLLRAFRNLYSNAVKYSYSGSKSNPRYVETICNIIDSYFTIEISNFGVGIMRNELKAIFVSGIRGEKAMDRSRTGSGLGLTEADRIIRKHQGEIKITSEDKGSAYKTTVKAKFPMPMRR